MKIKTVTCSTILAGLLAIPALVKGEEDRNRAQTMAWKDVPAAVQNTIINNVNGGTVVKVAKETTDDVVTYEAKVKGADGKKSEINVAADGTLIKAKEEGNGKATDDHDKDK